MGEDEGGGGFVFSLGGFLASRLCDLHVEVVLYHFVAIYAI